MSTPIEILVVGKDGASVPLRSITKELATLGKTAQTETAHTSGFFKTVAAAASGFLTANLIGGIGRQFAGFARDAIQESRDAAHGLAQTEAAIKSTGGAAGVTAQQIVDMASALSHTTLFTDDAIQAQENLFLTFTNIKNAAGENNDIFNQATKASLDLAQAMGGDTSGAAIQLGKALNDPVAGISALTRVGVAFTDQQKEQIKTLVESGNVLGAQKIILAEVTKEFGGSAEAAMKADGGYHLFQQRLADVEQTIGDALQPALASLMGFMAGPGLDAVESLGGAVAHWISGTAIPALTSFIGVLGDLGKYIGAVVDDGDTLNDWLSHLPGWLQPIAKIGGDVITTMQGLGGAIKDAISGLASGDFSNLKIDLSGMFGDVDTSAITTALQSIREGWGLARDALITFQEAWNGDWKNADTIHPLHQAVGDFGSTARAVFDWLATTGIPEITTSFNDAMPGNIQLIKDLSSALSSLQGTSHTTSAGIRSDINAWFDPNANPAVWINVTMQSFNRLGTETRAILRLAGSDWQVFWGQVKTVFTDIGAAASSFSSAMGNMFSQIGTAVGIASAAFSAAWQRMQDAVTIASAKIVGVITGIEGAFGAMTATIGAKINEAVGWIASLPGRASGALQAVGTVLISAGAQLISGFIAGIQSKFDAVKSLLGTLTSMLPKWKGPPATDAKLLFENGKLIIQGLIDGFGAMTPGVRDKLKSITDMIAGVFDAGAKGVDFFGKLTAFKAPSTGTIDAFAASTAAIVRSLGTAAQIFKAEWLTHAQTFFDTAGKGLGIIGAGVDGLTKLRTFKAPSIANINAFTDTVTVIVQSLGTVAQIFKDGWLAKASEFEDTAGKGLALLGNGVDGLTKLRDFKAPSIAAINAFSDTVILVVQSLGTVAQTFKEAWLAKASIFADAAAKGIGIIGGAIEGFTKLSDYTGIAPHALATFAADLQMVMARMIMIAQDFGTKGPAAAAIFGDAVGRTIAPLGAAVEAFTKINDYKGVLPAAVQLLGDDIAGVVGFLGVIAQQANTVGVAAAVAFATATGAIFSALKTALDALNGLRDYKGVAQEQVTLLMHDMTEVFTVVETMNSLAAVTAVNALSWKDLIATTVSRIRQGAAAVSSLDGLNIDASVTMTIHERTGVTSGGGGVGAGNPGSYYIPISGARAGGGPVTAGLGYLVNEREQEYFFPGTSGTVVPQSKMPRNGGDTTITIQVDARGSSLSASQIEQASYKGTQRAMTEAGRSADVRMRTA